MATDVLAVDVQRPVQPDAPFSANGDADGPVPADGGCVRCGRINMAGAGRCAKCGVFLTHNQEARQTGVRAQPENQPIDIRMDAETLRQGIVSDLGGLEELTTVERAYVQDIADVHTTLRLLLSDIASRGMFTPAGSVRRSYQAYLAGIDRFDRLAQRIGLKRRTRKVPTVAQLLERD